MDQLSTRPRRLISFWRMVRDGLPSAGRYRRYIVAVAPVLAAIWGLTILYLVLAPPSYVSTMTLILPGSGVGGSMNVDSIGQASTVTSSAFSSPTLSPTENYKRMLMSDTVLERAARIAGERSALLPAPTIKLVDQTNLIEAKMTGRTATQARTRGEALRRAFLTQLDDLRSDEAAKRTEADQAQIVRLQSKAREAQRKLLAFQGATGLVSLEQFNSRISMLDQLHDREREASTVARQQAATTARLGASLGISIADARRAFVLKADPLFQNLLARYALVRTDRTEKTSTLGDAHFTARELNADEQALRSALLARGRALTGLSDTILMSFADLSVAEGRARMFEAMATLDSQSFGSGAGLAEIRRQIAARSAASARLVTEAGRLADLVRDVRITEAVFSSALAKLDTNRSDPFASYPLVQTLAAPSLPQAPAAPSVKIALAGALAASVLVLIGFAMSWLRQPIIHRLLPKA